MDELAAMPEQQRAQAMQQMQIVPGDPRLQQVIRIDNDITDMDIDITIEEGIDVPSIQAEQFQVLIQLAGTQPGLIPPEILIAASNLRNKDELLEMLKEHQQAAAQKQQVMEKMATDKAQADTAATRAKAAADFALAKERQHATVHHIADVHGGFAEMNAPPDPPSDPGTVVPPEVQAALNDADIRGRHAKAMADEARAGDLRQSAVERVNNILIARHNALAPPEQPGGAS
jgi:outer membrane translocation and assembly module TamA